MRVYPRWLLGTARVGGSCLPRLSFSNLLHFLPRCPISSLLPHLSPSFLKHQNDTCKHGSREVGTVDASGTPPLTAASPAPAPAIAISAGLSSFNVPFFGSRYSRDDDDDDISEKVDENGASPAEHGEIPPVQGSGATTPVKQAKIVVPVDDGERTETAAAAAPVGERSSGDGGNKRPRTDVAAAFITNTRQCRAVAVGEACVLVQAARIALGGCEGCVGARSPLQEIAITGEGSFGIVSGATHSFLPGEFAVKRLKEVGGPVTSSGSWFLTCHLTPILRGVGCRLFRWSQRMF
ncbi:unnamed protein product [Ectocarpus sp. CCAP 1310/34]|nr:unnamed protein product [Ectocarpus sp. CCAP 1310/34]